MLITHLVELWLGDCPQLSDHLGQQITCKLEEADVTESEIGMTELSHVSRCISIEGDMTAIENVGCCGSRSLAQWTARIVLDPHSAEVHRVGRVSDPALSRKES